MHDAGAAGTRGAPRPNRGSNVILAIFVLSGAAGLVYEVVWARQLVLVFGNTTQAISAILTGFFGGMAIGSVVGGRVADRVKSALRLYGVLELILVVVVLATPLLFRGLHEVYRGAYGSLSENPLGLGLIRFALALLALAPATIFMGATLPTLSRHLTRGRAAGLSREFGRLYAANTLGAIFGTVISGFVLIEVLGLTGTLLVGALCSGAAGVAALILSRREGATDDLPRRRARAGGCGGTRDARGTRDTRGARGSGRNRGTHRSTVGPFRGPRARPLDRARRRLRVGPDLARVPGPVDAAPLVGQRQHDLHLHDDPADLPRGHRRRCGALSPPAWDGAATGCSPSGSASWPWRPSHSSVSRSSPAGCSPHRSP